jgi:hypothetical protein
MWEGIAALPPRSTSNRWIEEERWEKREDGWKEEEER